jgi:tetratricopeptide (TPR) repeat protein
MTTKGSGSVRDSFVRLIVPGLLIATLVGVLVIKWRPAQATEPAPLPAGTLTALHRDAARSARAEGHEAFLRTALRGRVGDPGGLSTARDDLSRAVAGLQQRLSERPNDTAAASRLADVLLRQSRVLNNPGLAVRAEEVLRAALQEAPEDYESTRMLGTVLLSQHRFRDAIEIATRARAFNENDAWNYGVLGDAWLELGDYQQAFDTFDEMMKRRPSAAAYARVSYAKELQGDLNGALQLMRMATDATSAHDPEGQAWHHVQVGDLLFKQGKLTAAKREFDHAAFIFPDHPMAAAGQARVMAAEQNFAGALAIYEDLMAKGQLPHLAAHAGDMHARLGHDAEAAKMYALAENGWRFDTPEPAALVGFLAMRGRALGDAVTLGERASASRKDVPTMDALAWAYFKAGRVDDALKASKEALRTGTRERSILYHAAAIHRAAGDTSAARMLIGQALDGHPEFDPIEGPAARELAKALTPHPNPLPASGARE